MKFKLGFRHLFLALLVAEVVYVLLIISGLVATPSQWQDLGGIAALNFGLLIFGYLLLAFASLAIAEHRQLKTGVARPTYWALGIIILAGLAITAFTVSALSPKTCGFNSCGNDSLSGQYRNSLYGYSFSYPSQSFRVVTLDQQSGDAFNTSPTTGDDNSVVVISRTDYLLASNDNTQLEISISNLPNNYGAPIKESLTKASLNPKNDPSFQVEDVTIGGHPGFLVHDLTDKNTDQYLVQLTKNGPIYQFDIFTAAGKSVLDSLRFTQ